MRLSSRILAGENGFRFSKDNGPKSAYTRVRGSIPPYNCLMHKQYGWHKDLTCTVTVVIIHMSRVILLSSILSIFQQAIQLVTDQVTNWRG